MVALSTGSNENRKTRMRNGRRQEVFVAFLDKIYVDRNYENKTKKSMY